MLALKQTCKTSAPPVRGNRDGVNIRESGLVHVSSHRWKRDNGALWRQKKWGQEIANFPTDTCKFFTDETRMLKTSILSLNSLKMGQGYLAQNVEIFYQNFPTRRNFPTSWNCPLHISSCLSAPCHDGTAWGNQ